MQTPASSLDPALSAAVKRSIHDHWRIFLAEGLILAVLGLAAVVAPLIAGLAATIFLGWLLLAAGIAGGIFTFWARTAPGFPWALLSALAATVAGFLLLWEPLQSLITLTLVLVIFFIVDGIATMVLAIAHRRELSGKWQWMMVNGFLDLILAGFVILGLPFSLAWALGLLVGIDMIFGGMSLIAMALEAHKGAQEASA